MEVIDKHADNDVLAVLDVEVWIAQSYKRMHSALTVVTQNRDTASDVLHDALVKAVEKWDLVSSMESPEGWLFTVALNRYRRQQRRRGRLSQILRLMPTTEPSVGLPDGVALDVWAAVAQLPERQRVATALRHVGHLTEPEIAQIMGVERGTVSSTLRSAHKTLRTILADYEKEPRT